MLLVEVGVVVGVLAGVVFAGGATPPFVLPPDVPPDDAPPEVDVVVVVEVVPVVLDVVVVAGAGVDEPVVGTVNGGAPVVSVDAAPPPPHPAVPTINAAPVVTVASRRTAPAERIRRMPGSAIVTPD